MAVNSATLYAEDDRYVWIPIQKDSETVWLCDRETDELRCLKPHWPPTP